MFQIVIIIITVHAFFAFTYAKTITLFPHPQSMGLYPAQVFNIPDAEMVHAKKMLIASSKLYFSRPIVIFKLNIRLIARYCLFFYANFRLASFNGEWYFCRNLKLNQCL